VIYSFNPLEGLPLGEVFWKITALIRVLTWPRSSRHCVARTATGPSAPPELFAETSATVEIRPRRTVGRTIRPPARRTSTVTQDLCLILALYPPLLPRHGRSRLETPHGKTRTMMPPIPFSAPSVVCSISTLVNRLSHFGSESEIFAFAT
jgi:hypothetical protein